MNVWKITFSSSAFAGRKILEAVCHTNLKRVSLELGDKGPSSVKDCDIKNILFWAQTGITSNNRQVCAE